VRNESKGQQVRCLRWDRASVHHRPVGTCHRSESERIRWDPKDGELCLSRAKSGETLMEARRDSNVQIDLQTWV
jgi:hypothetical protein